MVTTYVTAEVSRDGKWWLVYVKEINKYTQACSLAEAEMMARDLTALWLHVPPESVEVTVNVA